MNLGCLHHMSMYFLLCLSPFLTSETAGTFRNFWEKGGVWNKWGKKRVFLFCCQALCYEGDRKEPETVSLRSRTCPFLTPRWSNDLEGATWHQLCELEKNVQDFLEGIFSKQPLISMGWISARMVCYVTLYALVSRGTQTFNPTWYREAVLSYPPVPVCSWFALEDTSFVLRIFTILDQSLVGPSSICFARNTWNLQSKCYVFAILLLCQRYPVWKQ